MSDTDERLMIATYEALQAQVDDLAEEQKKQRALLERMNDVLELNLVEPKAQGKYP